MDKKENQTVKDPNMDFSKEELLKEANSRKKAAQATAVNEGEKKPAAKKKPTATKQEEAKNVTQPVKKQAVKKPDITAAKKEPKKAEDPKTEFFKEVQDEMTSIANDLKEAMKRSETLEGKLEEEDKKTVTDSLQKLKDVVKEQKRIEKELMEKEAKKTQDKDLLLKKTLEQLEASNETIEEDVIDQAELDEYKARVEVLMNQIAVSEDEINKLAKHIEAMEELSYQGYPLYDKSKKTIHASLDKLLKDKEKAIEALEKEVAFRKSVIESSDIAYQNLSKSYEELEKVVEKISDENKALKQDTLKEAARIKEMDKLIRAKEKEIAEAAKLTLAAEKKLEAGQGNIEKIKELEAIIKQKEKEILDIQKELQLTVKKLEAKDEQINKTKEEAKAKVQEINAEHRAIVKEKEKQIRALTRKVEKLEKQLPEKLAQSEAKLRSELEQKMEKELAEKQKTIDSLVESHKQECEKIEKKVKDNMRKANELSMAKKAKAFEKQLAEQLEEKERIIQKEKEETAIQLAKATQEVEALKVTFLEKEENLAKKYAELEEIKKLEIDDAKKQLADSNTLKEEHATLEEKYKELEEKIASLEQEKEQMATTLAEEEAKRLVLANTLKESNSEVEGIKELITQQKRQLEEDEETLASLAKELEEKETLLEEKVEALNEKDAIIQEIKLQLAEEKQHSRLLDSERDERNLEKIARLEGQNQSLADEIESLRKQFEQKTIEMAEDYETSLEELEIEHDKLVQEKEEEFVRRMNSIDEAYKKDLEKKESEYARKMDEIEENYNLILSEREQKFESKIQELEYLLAQYESGEPVVVKESQVVSKEKESTSNEKMYREELDQLRAEIERMKRSTTPTFVKEDAEEKEEKVPTTYLDNDTRRLIQEVREEILRTREEMKHFATSKEFEMKELSSEYEKRLRLKEMEKNELEDRNYEVSKKMERLSKEIEDREYQISEMDKRYRSVAEEDILDPDFKRKIRTIRDMKAELERRSQDEESMYLNGVKNINTKADIRKQEIDSLLQKIRNLEKDYYARRDFTSSAKDEFERAKARLNVELDLQQARLNELVEEDSIRIKTRYQNFLKEKDEQMARLVASEIELIDYYLEKRKKELSLREDYAFYKQKEEEKKQLVKQLEELKSTQQMAYDVLSESRFEMSRVIETNEDLKNTIQDDYKLRLSEKIKLLDARYKELSKELTTYTTKLQELRTKQEERVQLERKLRTNEKSVEEYQQQVNFLHSMTKEFETNKENLLEYQKEVDEYREDPNKRSEFLKRKAAIQDLEILQEDLTSKMNYAKDRITELKKNDKVTYYTDLIASMEKIRQVYQTLKDKAKTVRDEMNTVTRELENLKAERIKSV